MNSKFLKTNTKELETKGINFMYFGLDFFLRVFMFFNVVFQLFLHEIVINSAGNH